MPNQCEDDRPKLLVLAASPTLYGALNLSEEIEKIREGLKYFGNPIDFEQCAATTPQRLFRGLLFHKPTYVHFCGHGLGQEGLVLTDDNGRESPITAEALGGLFEHFAETVRCVVLNACYSGLQAKAIVRHIDFVVGMNAGIEDADAINFSIAFYEALSAGKPIPSAFGLACSMMQFQPSSGSPRRSRHLIPEPSPPSSAGAEGPHVIPELFQREVLRDGPSKPVEPPRSRSQHCPLNTFEKALATLQRASRPSLSRAEERLEPFTSGETALRRPIQPIDRTDTGPDLQAFLNSTQPLLLILGDSGYGKSTLLYQIATKENGRGPTHSLFYDIHQVEQEGSLRGRLAADLHCSSGQLRDSLDHLAKLVGTRRGQLLILVDAINEAQLGSPEKFRYEIESLAEDLPAGVKLIYSCRKVYWSLYLEGGQVLSRKVYFGSSPFNLLRYSAAECRLAFEQYKRAYYLKGSFSRLPVGLQDKIRDPLMLRMLSDGYSGRSLPAFAPAVLVFQTYMERLAKLFATTHVMSFLEAVIDYKARQVVSRPAGSYDDQLVETELLKDPDVSRLHFAQLNDPRNPSKPLHLLEDEGILQSLDDAHTRFRFAYDRFYEYLLGKALGPRLLKENSSDLAACLEQHLCTMDQSQISVWQALKSELVRRNLEPNNHQFSLYSTNNLLSLMSRGVGPVDSFTRELLRELVFEAQPEFAERLQELLGKEDRWTSFLVDVAPDSLRMLPALADALLSGSQQLARRVSHSLARFSSIGEAHERFEALLRVRLETRFRSGEPGDQEKSLRGLVYYSAVVFARALERGEDPVLHILSLWKMILDILPFQRREKIRVVAGEVWKVIEQEGPQFFGDEDRVDGLEYVWKTLDDNLKQRALEVARCFVDTPRSLHREVIEVVSFFAAKQRHWNLRGHPEQDEVYSYKLEFKLAQWLLIYRSRDNYGEVAQILQTMTETDYWENIDFALCTMEFILKHNYADDRRILEDGFQLMKSWTRHFEEDLGDQFYSTLSEPDPFKVNYIPVGQLVGVDTAFFAPSNGPVPTLEERFVGSDPRALRLALLASRYFWRGYPEKVLGSLKLLLESEDHQVSEWLERILKEIFLVYPQLVERFLAEFGVSQERTLRIKHEIPAMDPSGFRHDIDPLMKFLFLGSSQVRARTVEWYDRLLSSAGPYEFLEDLVCALFPGSVTD